MIDVNDLLTKMQSHDYSGFGCEEFERVFTATRERCLEFAWKSLLNLDGYQFPGCASLCLDLWDLLKKGNAIDERLILQEWPEMSGNARANICYAFPFADLLSVDLAIALFAHPSSTVDDRYMIVSEISRPTRQPPLDRALLLSLSSRIGRYDDQSKQKRLDRFIKEVTLECQNSDQTHAANANLRVAAENKITSVVAQ